MPLVNTRVFFSKLDRAKYISHLDLAGVMQRAIKRAALPVWYTEGYNPRMYTQFMLPLSLGQESLREAVDMRLLEQLPFSEIAKRMNEALPSDIRVTEVGVPVFKNTDIAAAEYEISGELDFGQFREFVGREHIPAEKKTKKGVSELDLKQHILFVQVSDKITIRLPAGVDFNVNPQLVLDAFSALTGSSVSGAHILRTKILTKNGEEFR